MADRAAPQHSSGITHAGSSSAAGQPDVTPSSGASDEQTSPVAVWAALAVVVGLVGFVVLSVVASTVVIFFFSTSQAPCVDPLGDGTSTTGGDNSVPLPAADPSARLQVSIVSWNTYYKNSTANILRGFRAIEAAGGASVGLQEQNSPSKLRDLQRRLAPEWAFVGTQTRHPIAYRTGDYQLLASGVVKEHGPHKIESGPGGRSVGNKYVVWVELRDKRTRATFIHINDHKIAAVERSGHPRKDNPTRVRLWHQEDQAVGEVIAKLKPLGVPIFKTADENLAAKADAKVRDKGFAYAQMQKRGMYSNWRVLGYPKEGTHGTRAIDYVWATTNLAAPVGQRILGKYGSDHSILVVDLDNQKAASTARTAQASLTTKTAAKPAAKAPAGSTTNVSEEAVWRALRASGFDSAHAAAAMGNMKDESGFDPQIIQGGGHSKRPADAGGGGYGLVQWTPGRKLSDYIGSATPTVENEVAALKAQLDGKGAHPEKVAGDAFWAATDTATAAKVFHLRYERSASKDSSRRVSNALDIERRLQDTVTDGDVGATTPCPPTVGTGIGATGGGPVPSSFNHQGNPHTVEEAIAWMQANAPDGAPGEPVLNGCERYMNLAYGLGGGYPTALAHWNASGPRTPGMSVPPRGALVFWRSSNPAGHVALSLGNGQVISTDFDGSGYRAGVLHAGPISAIDRFGPRLGWRAPNFKAGSEKG
jgi:hypothetical protein